MARKHLRRRRNGYYYAVEWDDKGQDEIRRALKTKDYNEARQLLPEALEDIRREICWRTGRAPVAELKLDWLAKRYIENLESKGCSPVHIQQRRSQLKKVFNASGVKTVAGLTAEVIRTALVNALTFHLTPSKKKKAYTAATKNKYRDAIHAFFEWLRSSQKWKTNPVDAVPKFKDHERAPRRGLSAAELARLLSCEEIEDHRRVIYRVMATTGIRPNEARKLDHAHVDFKKKLMTVTGEASKTSLRRTLPLVPATIKAWKAWLKNPVEECVVKGRSERWWKTPHILPRLPQKKTWANDLERAGIEEETGEGKAVLYSLRATYCSNLFRAGVDIRTIQRLMGHADVKTTMRHYAKMNTDDIHQAGDKLAGFMEEDHKDGPRLGSEAG